MNFVVSASLSIVEASICIRRHVLKRPAHFGRALMLSYPQQDRRVATAFANELDRKTVPSAARIARIAGLRIDSYAASIYRRLDTSFAVFNPIINHDFSVVQPLCSAARACNFTHAFMSKVGRNRLIHHKLLHWGLGHIIPPVKTKTALLTVAG